MIRAEFGSEFGEVVYDSVPLNVTSLNLMMGDRVGTAAPVFSDDFMGTQTGIASPMGYMFGCNGMGDPAYTHNNNGKLELMSQFIDPDFNYCTASSAVSAHIFHDLEIIDAGGFQISVDFAWADDATSGFAIGIGEDPIADPNNFNPLPSVDAMVEVLDNEVVVRLFDNGTVTSVNSLTTGIPASLLENVTLDVEFSDFGSGGLATLTVIVNGTAIAPLDFTWDGGPNHIEIRGGSTATETAMVAIDNLTIRPGWTAPTNNGGVGNTAHPA